MQDEISQLVSMIVENRKGHRVISIYGMGGLGKTTLARKIYDHSKVKHCFEAFAWHCISQQYDFKVVLRDILKQLVGESSATEEDELVRELYNVQTQKKCLIVLDDVWEMDDWRVLSKAFPIADQAVSSKILLTTRKKDVAEVTEREYPHELRNLTVEESWQLLQKIVFLRQEENDVKRDPKLESVGREIVGRCGGLPLAISALGGMLKSRNSSSEWRTVSKDIDLYLSKSEGSKEGAPLHVLALSYNDLPYDLKSCFLYMGIFKEDEEIEVEKLCHLWIAEGLVSSKHRENEETMMDVANHNLIELASRSMVQVKESCKLHDLMRDLCLDKGKEEQFLENLDMGDRGDTSSLPETSARRLAIYVGEGRTETDRREQLPYGILSLEQITNQSLRALFVSNATLRGPPNLKLCRVLDFKSCVFHKNKLPKEIRKMLHLRYLSVDDCHLKKLPSFIGELQYLETLYLNVSSELIQPHVYNILSSPALYLPNIFSKMKRLKRLYLFSFHCGSKKLQLNGLSGLETLVGFDSERVRHKDLLELVNLRYFVGFLRSDDWSLVISHIDSWKKIEWVDITTYESSLEQTHFQKLLMCRNLNSLELKVSRIGKLPQYEPQFWPNLIRLNMEQPTEIDEESFQLLKKLPKLQELILGGWTFRGKEFIFDATDFPQLRSLEIYYQHNLEKWRMDEGALPNLSSLVIGYCKKLEIIPEDGLKYLTNLEELNIDAMPEEFKHKYGKLHDQQGEDLKEALHEIS